MSRLKFIQFFVLLFCSIAATSLQANDSIIVIKDARLDILSAKQAMLNKRSLMMTSNGQYKGFRIQVVSTTNRDNAQRIKTDLMNKFSDQKSYLLFQSPNFKVRIGNFLKKEDAENFRKQLSKYFPQGVYIVEDAIEYVPKEEEIF